MQLEHAAGACSLSMQLEHAARACSWSTQLEHAFCAQVAEYALLHDQTAFHTVFSSLFLLLFAKAAAYSFQVAEYAQKNS
jgi:hypothetical protein